MNSVCSLKDRSFIVEAGSSLEVPIEAIEEVFVGIDTETEFLVKGQEIKPVILQVCYPKLRLIHIVEHPHMSSYLQQLLQMNSKIELVFHNMPFDLNVLKWKENNLLVTALKENRCIDIGLRFILNSLETGTYNESWSLEYIAAKVLGIKLNKDENIRFSFKQNQPLTLEQINYAALDSAATVMIREILTEKMPTELVQNLGHIVLTAIGETGMLIDKNYFRVKQAEIKKKLQETEDILSMFGYYKKTKGNNTQIQKLMANMEQIAGVRLPRTEKTKDIQVNAETVECFGENPPPFLIAYREFIHFNKYMSTYLNEELIGPDGRVHPYFSPMVITGRTSCSGPNIQNVPRDFGIRGIYIAPPGYCLMAVDYSQLELRVLAEHCFQMYGQSRMMEIINSGVDLHLWFGKEIMKASGLDPNQADEETLKEFRQRAKSASFGYPGGLGALTFQEYAKVNYNVIIDKEEAEHLKELWLDSFPEMKKHLRPLEDVESTARNLRNFLRSEYPNVTGISNTADLREYLLSQNLTDKEINKIIGEKIQRYMAVTISGRTKRDCTYCAASNLPFQAGASDGAKLALWYVYSAKHRIVNFVHDEIITEQRIDDKLQENAKEVSELMIKGMKYYLKNTNVAVEVSLMTRWDKGAKQKKDAEGNFLFYHPKETKETSGSMVSLLV